MDQGDTKVKETVKLDKTMERVSGPRTITVYSSPDNKVKATVYNRLGVTSFDEPALTTEISKIAEEDIHWGKEKPKVYDLHGHSALTTMIYETSAKSNLKTNCMSDRYFTVIACPETNSLLTITSNGDNVTWDLHEEIVERLMT